MNVDPFKGVSLELALNSRVSTGGWKGIERAGQLSSLPITPDQVEFVFWCLSHTPNVSKKPIVIKCDNKVFNKETHTLDGERISINPTSYPRIKCPSIRLHWNSHRDVRDVKFSNQVENAYLLEQGMGQEMVHIAGSVSQVGVNMIGGVYVDLVPMVPYLSSKSPQKYRHGNLPEPLRDGTVSAVDCIEGWQPSEMFTLKNISPSQLGQLLWAGYGCIPHKTFRYHRYGTLSFEGQGKTIPSASATYTTALYVIIPDGIFKYMNWNVENGIATHSLGIIKKGDRLNIGEYQEGAWKYTRTGDLLEELRQLVPGLPKASAYLMVASNGRLRPFFSLMEAGYVVLHVILQAQALDLNSNIVVLSQDQMTGIRGTIGIMDIPVAIVPVG